METLTAIVYGEKRMNIRQGAIKFACCMYVS